MNKKENRRPKKIHDQRGFTLVEMMAAVLVLILLILLLNTGLNLAIKSYRDMTAEAETQLLLSSVSDVLSDELRYARDIVLTTPAGGAGGVGGADGTGGAGGVGEAGGDADSIPATDQIEGNVQRFLSVSYGRNTVLSLKEGQLYAGEKRMLASGAYGNGDYRIQRLSIVYDDVEKIFKVDITVGGIDDIKAEDTFVIKPLNAIDKTNTTNSMEGDEAA